MQVRKTKVPEDGICKYGIRKYEYAMQKMQVWKTQVRICNGGKRKYSDLKSINNLYSSTTQQTDTNRQTDRQNTTYKYN